MASNLQAILKLEVPVIVRIGQRRASVEDVLRWVPGCIFELHKPASQDELDLLVNNVRIASGKAVKVCENFGLRIEAIGGLRERIDALAGAEATAGAEPGGESAAA